MVLFTGGSLDKFRSAELVGRSARRGRRQIRHRLMAQPLIETLDDPSRAARRSLQLREADDDAEPDEQSEDENRARDEPLNESPRDRYGLGPAHSVSSPRRARRAGTSYGTRPRRTSSIAIRSAFLGICCSAAP